MSDLRLINADDGSDDVPQQNQDDGNGAQFEYWFDNDLHSDSADEELEENIIIVDPSVQSPSSDINADQSDGGGSFDYCFREGFHGDVMIPRLLDEAMRDVVVGAEVFRPKLRSANSNAEETLTSDEHLFNKDDHVLSDTIGDD